MLVQKELQGLVGDFSNFCKYLWVRYADLERFKTKKGNYVLYCIGPTHLYPIYRKRRYNQFVLRLESNLLSDPTLFRTHARYECNVRF